MEIGPPQNRQMAHDWFDNDPPDAAGYVSDIRSPWGFEDTFIEALEQKNPQMLHQSFKRWKNHLMGEYGSRDSDCLNYGLFPLKNTPSPGVRSVSDLDAENTSHLDFIRPIARAWRIGIFFAKIRATWFGPRDKSPNRLSVREREDDYTVSKYWFVEDVGEPPAMPLNAMRDPNDYTHVTSWTGMNAAEATTGIIEMYNLDGSVVLSPDHLGLGDDNYYIRVGVTSNLQHDFFPLDPDHEEIKRPKYPEFEDVMTEQTWYKNVRIGI